MAEDLGPDVPPSLYYAMGVQYTENFGRDEQLQPNQYINLDGFSNNSMNLTISFGIGIVLSITIYGDFYYE